MNGQARRKRGSVALAMAMGIALVVLGTVICLQHLTGNEFKIKDYAVPVNVGTCFFFGFVLLWWAVSGGNNQWGIGFETITMAVTVVLAVIAMLALTA
ncbi:hypothetical protein ACVWZ4_003231 [Bradyrhizobium sp. USDA 4472]